MECVRERYRMLNVGALWLPPQCKGSCCRRGYLIRNVDLITMGSSSLDLVNSADNLIKYT